MAAKATVRTAGIVLYTKDGRFLLQERLDLNKKNDEDWAFFGGRIEPGETAEQAMLRESGEELAWTPKEYRNLGMVSKDQGARVCLQHTFMASMPPSEHLHLREGKSMRLFTVAEARKLKINPGDGLVLDRIEEFLRKGN